MDVTSDSCRLLELDGLLFRFCARSSSLSKSRMNSSVFFGEGCLAGEDFRVPMSSWRSGKGLWLNGYTMIEETGRTMAVWTSSLTSCFHCF